MSRKPIIQHVVLSDLHYPLQATETIDEIVNNLAKYRVIHLHLLGDLYDLAGLSRFLVSSHDVARTASEIGEGRVYLSKLIRNIRPETCFFYLGNHEERLLKYLLRNAPALDGLCDYSLLIPKGVEPICRNRSGSYWGGLVLDDILFIHGDVVRRNPGAASLTLLREHNNHTTGWKGLVMGHTHHLALNYWNEMWAAESGHLSNIHKYSWLSFRPVWTVGFLVIRDGYPALCRGGAV